MLGDLGKLIVAKGFKKLPKVQNIAWSGHTDLKQQLTAILEEPFRAVRALEFSHIIVNIFLVAVDFLLQLESLWADFTCERPRGIMNIDFVLPATNNIKHSCL